MWFGKQIGRCFREVSGLVLRFSWDVRGGQASVRCLALRVDSLR